MPDVGAEHGSRLSRNAALRGVMLDYLGDLLMPVFNEWRAAGGIEPAPPRPGPPVSAEEAKAAADEYWAPEALRAGPKKLRGSRAVPKPVPSPDTITPTTPLRLDIAARIAFPDGSMGVSGLRREIARSNLRAEMIAGKIFTTLANIDDMRKKCAVPAKVPISCSASQDDPASGGDGSSSIHTEARARQAQAHSEMIAQGLKKRSRRTSQKSTSRNSAAVIPMKS